MVSVEDRWGKQVSPSAKTTKHEFSCSSARSALADNAINRNTGIFNGRSVLINGLLDVDVLT
jgi:hypothetical protein